MWATRSPHEWLHAVGEFELANVGYPNPNQPSDPSGAAYIAFLEGRSQARQTKSEPLTKEEPHAAIYRKWRLLFFQQPAHEPTGKRSTSFEFARNWLSRMSHHDAFRLH